ncbi:hypothetical protein DFH94DRAFT_686099 [Russula ochroleuca]|uniref:Uncharacterized protein n=1 Tax=Russula ochroleuca TaxID=152965 RepID=A0A9P5JV88_9AGAM|nr:hypothetical protein DFH94DRAFT_686099 [Russula ochroleuca]
MASTVMACAGVLKTLAFLSPTLKRRYVYLVLLVKSPKTVFSPWSLLSATLGSGYMRHWWRPREEAQLALMASTATGTNDQISKVRGAPPIRDAMPNGKVSAPQASASQTGLYPKRRNMSTSISSSATLTRKQDRQKWGLEVLWPRRRVTVLAREQDLARDKWSD